MTFRPTSSFRTLPIVLAALAAPLLAQSDPFAKWAAPDPARVAAGTYAVEPLHAQAVFQVDHLGITPYYGSFDGMTGTLSIDPKRPEAASVDVTIPIASLKTSVKALDDKLKSAEFLDAARYPAMRFRSTSVKVSGDLAQVAGDLTLHGVTRPVTVQARLVGAGVSPLDKSNVLGFEGRARIKRSEFGIGYGVPAVSDEITILIALPLEKKAAG